MEGSPEPVAIDAVGIAEGGGRQVARDIIAACQDEELLHPVWVFTSDEGLLEEFTGSAGVAIVDVRRGSYVWRAWWWRWGFARARRQAQCRASLHLANVALGRAEDAPRGVLIHQPNVFLAQNEVQRSGSERLRYWLLKLLIRSTVKRVDTVFVQTQVVAAAVMEQLGVEAERVVVAPASPPPLPNCISGRPSDPTRHVFLYVGSAAKHKNVGVLAQAAKQLENRVQGAAIVTSLTESELASQGGLINVGRMTRADVAMWLRTADALIMPSLTETVGLPMLEAMQVGCPVIAADRPYAHAICGRGALYFDPLQAQSLVEACERIVMDKDLRRRVVEAGSQQIERIKRAPGEHVIVEWLVSAVSAPGKS